ncbi:MAG: hypothetical protein R2699_01850 [Acidimicrobiales bacterium]
MPSGTSTSPTLGDRIRRVTPGGIISTVAGSGTAGFSGDGGAATAAQLNAPEDVAIASTGELLIADTQNHRIRQVSGGIISTVAGNGTGGAGRRRRHCDRSFAQGAGCRREDGGGDVHRRLGQQPDPQGHGRDRHHLRRWRVRHRGWPRTHQCR